MKNLQNLSNEELKTLIHTFEEEHTALYEELEMTSEQLNCMYAEIDRRKEE